MTKVVEAVYANGLLRPLEALELPEDQRVRLIVQTIDGAAAPSREAALDRLQTGIAGMDFRLRTSLPTRDELHDRI